MIALDCSHTKNVRWTLLALIGFMARAGAASAQTPTDVVQSPSTPEPSATAPAVVAVTTCAEPAPFEPSTLAKSSAEAPSAPPADFASPAATSTGVMPAAPGSVAAVDRQQQGSRPAPTPGLAERAALGFRIGLGRPSGEAWQGVKQSGITDGVLKAQADLNYRFGPMLVGGVYGALGFGSDGDRLDEACDGLGTSCSVWTVDLGVQGEIRLLPGAPIEPWLGASAGVDVISQNIDYGPFSESVNLYGPALAASAGVDIDFERFTFGPYVSYQTGWYTSIDITDSNENSSDAGIDDVARHGWLLLGVRGSHRLGS